jgi:hypothetical protein
MTRTIEQGDPESFSANCKAATHFAALQRDWKPRPFKAPVKSGLRAVEILLFPLSVKVLFRLAHGQVSSQANHDSARGCALRATEPRGGANPVSQGARKHRHYQICRCVQRDRDRAQREKLREHMAGFAIDELRNE